MPQLLHIQNTKRSALEYIQTSSLPLFQAVHPESSHKLQTAPVSTWRREGIKAVMQEHSSLMFVYSIKHHLERH